MRYSKFIFALFALLCIAAFCHAEQEFIITSASFNDNSRIPAKYTLIDDINVSPQLSWKNAPAGTKSFVITCIDLHPVAKNWVHWMIINIPASITTLPENASPKKIPAKAVELKNSFGAPGYGGPNPPQGTGIHNYAFTVYALNVSEVKAVKNFLTEKQLLQLIGDKIIRQASITGKCSR
jgi:hypothetical protein